ncbi:nucleoid-associated protein [Marinifilum fragile]|uniref:nucleoid-associated protein n=1 Tax=Marinifilum fragile TaxID=570161 RepID=UPI0006D255D6|nr:nucleoid-associated protein [Marinifilum fragile]
MTNIDFTEIEIANLVTHLVGNKLRDEDLDLSDNESQINEETKSLLLKYFLLPIKIEELYSFSHPIKLEMNEIYTLVNELFSDSIPFIEFSEGIAKLLYENSMHPKIKEGKLNVAFFSNIILEDEVVEAIGIFKSEKDVPFLKMLKGQKNFNISHEYGFEIKGIDKGCLILNTDKPSGYKILIIDNANKSIEAQYWKDDFLQVKPISNEYNQTNNFLGLTKQFLTKQLSSNNEISKSEQIDLLNRSVEYFKSHDSFEKEEFEKNVFKDEGIIKSFRAFDETYCSENNIEMNDKFDISTKAVKKQARAFKRVLKLDENFDILIKGDKELIEKGIDENGRKFYKIYYNEEK